MALFEFEHVTKRWPEGSRELTVLEDISFDVDAGDFVGLWGMRRTGKSTLLRIAAGIELPDEGRIMFAGKDLTALTADGRADALRMEGIGLVCSNARPGGSEEVVNYVALPLLADLFSLKGARSVAYECLEQMGVLRYAHMPLDSLSIGEAIRVSLARALAREPRLLLVDEPAAVASPTEREELYGLLAALGRRSDLAVLVASEDLGIIRRARRRMTIGSGVLRSMDKEGEVVSFPFGRVSDGRAS